MIYLRKLHFSLLFYQISLLFVIHLLSTIFVDSDIGDEVG